MLDVAISTVSKAASRYLESWSTPTPARVRLGRPRLERLGSARDPSRLATVASAQDLGERNPRALAAIRVFNSFRTCLH